MTPDAISNWQEHNRQFLVLAIDDLHLRMEGELGRAGVERQLEELQARMEFSPALLRLAETYGLGAFELDVVLLCLAAELDPRFSLETRPVTLGLALESLEGASWSALDAAGPLRRDGLVEMDSEAPLADAGLRLAGDVTSYLLGFDPRAGLAAPIVATQPPPVVVESQLVAARALLHSCAVTDSAAGEAPVIELHGATEEDRLALAAVAAAELEVGLATIDVRDLPPTGDELDRLLGACSRTTRLTGALLLIRVATDDDDPGVLYRVARAMDRLDESFFVSVKVPGTSEPRRSLVRREVVPLTADERVEVWSTLAGVTRKRLRIRGTRGLDDQMMALATRYRLTARAIQRICLEAEAMVGVQGEKPSADRLGELLRAGCALAVRAALDPLAERVMLDGAAQLALPEPEAAQIAELERQIRLAHRVDVQWGLGRGADRNVTALFAGASGTGKTHAALALAARLGVELYRVNVAGVLSKYIGETEQNLDRVFEAARIGGAILLFDEADALFGRRSEVRDSHDRYANLGTSYLLQRIERAPTPTILTTNLKDGIDPAFMRRLDFVIDFPFPDADTRVEIWRSIYPPQTPTGALEPQRLALVAATGGTIASIARRGAYLAAAEAADVEMRHLLESTRRELRKVGRDLSTEELSAWQ